MPDTVVEIPGVGAVAFPDTMSPDEINAAAAKLYGEAQPKADPSVLANLRDRGVQPMPSHRPRLNVGLGEADMNLAAASRETPAVVGDLAVGGAKGAANTAIGTGKLFNSYVPGIGAINEALYGPVPGSVFDAARREFATPTNDAQRIGFGAEQVAEFFALPAARGNLLARGAQEGTQAAALTAAQGGTGTQATTSGVLSASAPVVGRVAPVLSRVMQDSAAKNVSQAFNATTRATKRDVERITPRILSRESVIATTRPGMVRTAEGKLDDLGAQYDEAAGNLPTGDRLSTADVRAGIQEQMRGLEQTGSSGKPVPINPQKHQALKQLDETVEALGDRVSRETLQAFKSEWDDIVANAGGYSDKTGDALAQAQKWAYREGAGSIRRVLAMDSPDIDKLNAEWAFWTTVRDAAEASVMREKPQKGAMRVVMGAIGAGAGAAGGGDAIDRLQNAAVDGLLGAQGLRLIQSPGWKLASAQAKSKLADALMKGSSKEVSAVVGRLAAAMPGQVNPVFRPLPAH